MKKVTVVVTTYNSEKCIQKTLDSIFNQKGLEKEFELELIVVDDCSDDNTIDILRDNNIPFLSTGKNSGGPNKGRNMALGAATGDFICITDHDDEWNENKIISLLPHLENAPIVTSGYTLIDRKKNVETPRVNQTKNIGQNHIFYEPNVTFLNKLTKSLKGQNTYLGSIMYRSELKNILFEENFGMVDFDWVLRLFHQKSSIEICDSLYHRFVDESNLSLNEDFRRKDYYYSLMFIETYEKLYPAEVKISRKKINGSRARYFYLVNDMKNARSYFLKSGINFKSIGYYLTTFWGAKYIKRKFNVFG